MGREYAGLFIKINLGKKDGLLKTWFEKEIENEENYSMIVSMAILYYSKTGEYLNLGNISKINESLADIRRTVYISRNDVKDVVKQWTERGEIPATNIKRILRRGVSENIQKDNVVISGDNAIDAVCNLDKPQRNVSSLEDIQIKKNNEKESVIFSEFIEKEKIVDKIPKTEIEKKTAKKEKQRKFNDISY